MPGPRTSSGCSLSGSSRPPVRPACRGCTAVAGIGRFVLPRLVWRGACSDLERELGQAAGASVAAVAGPTAARCRVPAGDQARRRRVHRATRRGIRQPRLCGRSSWRGAVERRGDPLQGGVGRGCARCCRRARLSAPGGACGVRDLRWDPRVLGVRPQRAGAGLRPLPLQAGLAGRVAGRGRFRPGSRDRLWGHEHRADLAGAVTRPCEDQEVEAP